MKSDTPSVLSRVFVFHAWLLALPRSFLRGGPAHRHRRFLVAHARAAEVPAAKTDLKRCRALVNVQVMRNHHRESGAVTVPIMKKSLPYWAHGPCLVMRKGLRA
jgi:hypothetical protein